MRTPSRNERPKPNWRLPWFSGQYREIKAALIIRKGIAVIKGATGPKLSQSAPTSATTPERIANIPFQNVEMENVEEIHSAGNVFRSVCSQTYHASNVENRMDVATPPIVVIDSPN